MVKIRLMRVGKKKQPSFRVVVADSRSPRDGRIIEAIGHYNPRTEPSVVEIDTDRADYWLGQGAQPTQSVAKLLDIARSSGGAAAAAPQPAPVRRATPAASVTEAASEAPESEPAAPEEVPGEPTEEAPEETPAKEGEGGNQ